MRTIMKYTLVLFFLCSFEFALLQFAKCTCHYMRENLNQNEKGDVYYDEN